MVDITQQRAAERALAESERRFRTLAAASPAGSSRPASTAASSTPTTASPRSTASRPPSSTAAAGSTASSPPAASRSSRRPRPVAEGGGPAADRRPPRRRAPARAGRGSTSPRSRRRRPAAPGSFVGTIEDVTAEVEARAELVAARGRVPRARRALGRLPLAPRPRGPLPLRLARERGDARLPRPRSSSGAPRPSSASSTPRTSAPSASSSSTWSTAAGRPRPPRGASCAPTARCAGSRPRRARPRRDGDPYQVVAVTRDVTERKDAETRLAHQALHDALTGLPNRALFLDRLEQALRRASRAGGGVAVLFVDLDRFKLINDSFGHAAGDGLLCDVAARLRRALRPADTSPASAATSSPSCARTSTARPARARSRAGSPALFAEPFLVEDGEVFLQASIGIAIAGGDDAARGPDARRRRGDVPRQGRRPRRASRCSTRRCAATPASASRPRARCAARIERDELCIHVPAGRRLRRRRASRRSRRWCAGSTPSAASSRRATSSRWPRRPGLIVPIGDWVCARPAARCAAGRTTSASTASSAASTSRSASCSSPTSSRRSSPRSPSTACRPTGSCLEITESAVMENGTGTVATLRGAAGARRPPRARRLRHRLLVARLPAPLPDRRAEDRPQLHRGPRRGPPGRVDRGRDRLARAGARSRDVAEGIEDAAQARRLEALGCTFGQGFLFARPQPPAAFDDVLRAERALSPAPPAR